MKASTYDTFQALADPNRREILMMLSREKRSVNSIAEEFDISRPAVSKHLKVLYETGFITIEERGRERFCMLNQAGFLEVQDWMDYFENYWTLQLRSLDTFLKKKRRRKDKQK